MKRLPALVVGLGVAAVLAVAIALTFHAHPNGDDFCLAHDQRELGVLGCVEEAYRTQGGRWLGYGLACVRAAAGVTRAYPSTLVLVLLALVAAVRFAIPPVLGTGRDGRTAWGLGLVFVALYWAGVPHPGETFYWLDSAYVYLLNLALGLVLLGALGRLPEGRAPHPVALAGLAGLGFLVASFHELFALVLVGVLAAGALATWRGNDLRFRAWLVAGAGAALALGPLLASPGNEIRARGIQPVEQDPVAAVIAATEMWLRILDTPVLRGEQVGHHGAPLGWILDARLLAATVLFALSERVLALRPGWLMGNLAIWRWAIPALWLGAVTGCLLVGGYALGRTLPLRVFNGIYLVFLAGWFLTFFAWTRGLPARTAPLSDLTLLRTAGAVVLAIALLFASNTKQGIRDLARNRTAAYDREMTRRYAEAPRIASDGSGELLAHEVAPWPRSYYHNDVLEDPSAIQNQCWSRFFGVESVRLVRSRP